MKMMARQYEQMARMLRGKSMFSHKMKGGFDDLYGGRRRRRSRGKNYLMDRGQFGKMGFPSITGNMMGLVQSGAKMPNFMRVPPTVHINAEFRRLLGINANANTNTKQVHNDENISLHKCVIIDQHEICGVYNFEDKSIILRFIVADHYKAKIVNDAGESDGGHDVHIQKNERGLLELMMLSAGHGVLRNIALFDDLNDDEVDVETAENEEEEYDEYVFKTISWSDIDTKCNDLLFSFINYEICINKEDIYFKETKNDENNADGDISKRLKQNIEIQDYPLQMIWIGMRFMDIMIQRLVVYANLCH